MLVPSTSCLFDIFPINMFSITKTVNLVSRPSLVILSSSVADHQHVCPANTDTHPHPTRPGDTQQDHRQHNHLPGSHFLDVPLVSRVSILLKSGRHLSREHCLSVNHGGELLPPIDGGSVIAPWEPNQPVAQTQRL